MIIGRSPLRITLAGGGLDVPSYFLQFGGFVASAGIDQYICTIINKTHYKYIFLRYSQIEKAKSIDDIEHPIIREALRLVDIKDINIEITSTADQHSGTGLGSSSAFTCALLKSLFRYKKQTVSANEIAELACKIEIDILKEPIGKQDQYASSFSGLNIFTFDKDGSVKIRPLDISQKNIVDFENNLVMFSTGFYRAASKVLKDQNDKTLSLDRSMIDNLHYVKDLGYKSIEALESGNLTNYGIIMDEYWKHKRKRSSLMSNGDIDIWYEFAMKNGAIGGKVGGAGAGGFLIFYTEEKQRLIKAMNSIGLKETLVKFEFEGTKIL